MDKLTIIVLALLAVSEALALIPSVKSSSFFKRANGILHGLKELFTPKKLAE